MTARTRSGDPRENRPIPLNCEWSAIARQDRVAHLELGLGPGKVIARDLLALGLVVHRSIRIRAEQHELERLDWKRGLGSADQMAPFDSPMTWPSGSANIANVR